MENGREYQPIPQLPGVPSNDGWEFHTPQKSIDIDGFREEIDKILALANGVNNIEDILSHLESQGCDTDLYSAIIDDLVLVGILGDSREQHLRLHELSKNPSRFYRELSPEDIREITINDTFTPKEGTEYRIPPAPNNLEPLLTSRESCRSFTEQPVSANILSSVLRQAYSQELTPTPSAGGLYPLRLYLIVKNSDGQVPAGIYQYDHKKDVLVGLEDSLDEDRASYAMNSETLLFNSSTIFIISSDVNRHSSKYGNRGYRYSLLEAGHVAQNINLALTAHEVSCIEYGGFSDDELKKLLNLPDGEEPLITIGAGYPSTEIITTGLEIFDRLSVLVGADKPVDWVSVDLTSPIAQEADFYFASSKFKRPNAAYGSEEHLYSGGTALSIQLAGAKAIAEAFERYSGGLLRYDVRASANELDLPWLDPRVIRPLTDEQISNNPHLEAFNEDSVIEWIKITSYPDGDEYYAPIDLVFYPLNEDTLGRKMIAEADSSGMAAHTNEMTAIKKATLELIERDAIMRNWFTKEPLPRINPTALPIKYQNKIAKLKQDGRNVDVIDLSNNGVVIINVLIHSDEGVYPFFVNGAAASDESLEEALAKAFQEAELGLLSAKHSDEVALIDPKDVRSPADHGMLYLHDTYKSELKWLWSGELTDNLPTPKKGLDIIRQFCPYILKYTSDESPLYVVRAICPQLVPINFGYGNEYYSNLKVTQSISRNRNIPHYFA
jgi:thiazole/oxazole-forming peptide maturase SagD family component